MYHQVANFCGIVQYRVHLTSVEQLEGVDIIYATKRLKSYEGKPAKVLLVQEKAPYRPPYSFHLEKSQHDALILKQHRFHTICYFYAFYSVKDNTEFQQILLRTIYFPVSRIPTFNMTAKTVQTAFHPIRVFPTSSNMRGYKVSIRAHSFFDIFLRLLDCHIGLPSSRFPDLIEDLESFWKQEIPVNLMISDTKEKTVEFLAMKKKRVKDSNNRGLDL